MWVCICLGLCVAIVHMMVRVGLSLAHLGKAVKEVKA